MSFDLLAYARGRRYRTRNLHDGLPVPPARQRRTSSHRAAFGADVDRFDVIICRYGYVCSEGNRVGWALLCRSKRSLTMCLRAVQDGPGTVVKQLGDTEAAGDAPLEALESVLGVLEPYRRRPPSRGCSAEWMAEVRARRACVGA